MSRLSAAGRTPAASGGTGGRAAALARSGLRAAAGLLVVFAALLTLPLQAQAQTVGTLVSNTGKTIHHLDLSVGVSGSNKWTTALGFTAGDNEEGYTLSSVQVHTRFMAQESSVRVSIYSHVSGKPGSSLYVLTNPDPVVNGQLNTFTAPANATLDRETNYFVVVEAPAGSFTLRTTFSNAEDSGNASGWSIANRGRYRLSDSGNWSTWSDGLKARISIMGSLRGSTSESSDATLSDLTLSGGRLSPAFSSDVTDYTASVAYTASRTTVTAVKSEFAARIDYLDGDGDDLTDADTGTVGFQMDLEVGDNVIQMKVTAGDDSTTKTYKVTVTRAEFVCTAPDLSGRLEVWTATMTVGLGEDGDNFGYSDSESAGTLSDTTIDYRGNSYIIGDIKDYPSLSVFELILNKSIPVGDHDRLRLHVCGDTFDLASADEQTGDWFAWFSANFSWSTGITVSLALSATASSDATLSDLELAESGGAAVTLSPSFASNVTDYTASAANAASRITVTAASSDSAAADIDYLDGDGDELTDLDPGTDGHQVDLAVGENVIQVKLTAEDGTTTKTYRVTVTRAAQSNTDATLSALTLSKGTLSPSFASDVTDYTASVGDSASRIAVTAAKSDSAAEIAYLDGDDIELADLDTVADGHQVDLVVGANTIKVQVRAVNAEGDGQWSVEGTGMTGANTPATGAPAITGTAELDQTLSAGVTGISDANGKTKAEAGDLGYAYAYQWQRVDDDGSSNPADIAGATQSTYTVISADVGRRIRVTVSFTDDAGYAEGPLTSNALPGAGTVTCDGVWCATLYVQGIGSGNRGCANSSAGNACSNTAHLSEDAFTHDLTDYAVTSVQVRSDGELRLFLNPDIAVGSESLVLHAGSATFAFQDADTTGANSRYWSNSGLGWDIDDAVELKLTEPDVSADATLSGLALADSGGNTISLGETFVPATTTYTASVANGIGTVTLTATKNDSNATVVIASDNNTGTPGVAELNLIVGSNTLTVTVTAQDGATEQEYTITVTRARATTTTRATLVSNTNLTPNTSSSNGFYAQRFVTGANASGYNISTVKVAFGLTSGSSTRVRIRKSNSNNINSPGDLVATLTNPGNLSIGLNTFTALANTRLDPGTNYWITVNEGIPSRAYPQLTSGDDETGEPGWSIGNGILKRSVETVGWGSQTHSLLMEINGTLAVATAATGAPAITGTASLGQTLSAGTAGISDANGTTKAEAGDAGYAYAYQWQRVDADGSSNPMDIVGATQSTYTVISADVGSKIRVQVNFTDDAGFAEGPLTSNALPAAGTVTCDGVWCATLTAQDTGNNNRGCANSSAASACTDTAHLSEDEFAHAASNYSVASVNLKSDGQLRLFVDPNIGVGIRSLVLHVGSATFAFEDANERTGRSRYWDSSGLSWSIDDAVELKLTEPDVSTDATLSGLALADSNGDTISLGETFVPATTTYTASVAHGIDTVTLTATKNDSNATVVIASDNNTGTPGVAELNLIVGSNTLTVTVTAQDGTTEQEYTITVTRAVPPVPVDIEPNYDSIGAGLEDLVFTLTREGATTDELEATVTIVQAESWLGNSDLSHTVTFTVGDDTATLTLGASRFSFDPDTSGNLTATVTGAGIAGASAPVTIISTADAPITVSYDMSSYTFAEDAAPADVIINVEATLDSAYPRAPSRKFRVGFSTRSDTAISPGDYGPISWSPEFLHADYGPASGGGFVARKRLENNEGAYFSVEDDDVYEGTERLGVRIEIAPGFPFGLVQIAYSDGSTCAPTSSSSSCVPIVEYPVIITDEEDRPVLSLAADPASIAEEDDDTTTTVAENASVLTVAAASPKTFATEQTITLTFTGSAVYGTHYNVTPVDADANATGHQVTLPAETASVQVTVTATANDTVDGHRSIDVTGSRDGTAFGTATTIALPDNDTAQVTGVSVTSGNAQLAVNWTAVDNATGYQVQWKSGNESYNTNRQATVTSGTTTSHTITGLTNGTEYTVRVSATRTDANDGPPSAEETGTPAAPGVTVSKTTLTVTEQDTAGDSYTVALDTEPTANVTVTVAGHSGTDVTPNPTTLTFTASNWDTAQTVTVTAGNDTDTDDDMVALTHSAASTDSDYSGIAIDEVAVTVSDNDTAQVTGVSVTSGNAQLVVIWAAVDNATGYKVQWKSGSQDYNTGSRQSTVTSGSTASHTIMGLANGTEYTVRVSATRTDANDGPPSAEETGTPAVPIAPGVTVSKTALTVTEQDTTGDGYTVVLDTEPTANVTVTVAGHAGTDVTPNPTTLTFTASNWDAAQTVTVTAGNDADTTDDTVTLTHSAASTDTGYGGIAIDEVAVTVSDNDTAQVTGVSVTSGNAQLVVIWAAVDNATGYKVQWKSGSQDYNTGSRQFTVTSGSTASHTITGLANGTEYTVRVSATRTDANDGPPSAEETGTPAVPIAPGVTVSKTTLTVTEQDTAGDSYTVALDTEPTANVTVTVAGHSGTDVTPNPTTLTFTASNWDTAQTVTVTAGNDTDTDDDMVALTHSAASTDSDYSGIAIDEVAVTVSDNDTAQVTGVSVTSGNAQLVVIWAAVDNATGYKVQWKSGSQDYNTGSRQSTVTSGSTTSHTITGLTNGTEYTVRVSATRTDANDGPPSAEETGTPAVPIAPGVTVSTTALTVTEEDTTGDGYTVVLDTEPTANVTVTVAGHAGTDVTANPATLTFTTSNWDTVQTVTVTAGDDADTTDDTVTLTHSAASTDSGYGGIAIDEVAVTVSDNDTAQVTGVSVTSGNARLVTNWTAVDNATGYQVQWKSGNESYNTNRQSTVTSGTTTSHTITGLTNGTEYTVRVSATRTDANDGPPSAEETGTPAVPIAPGVTVSTTALTVTEQDTAGDSYTVALDTQPTATVTVTVAGHAGTDVTPNPTTLTFTTSNWDTVQTVTVTAGNDTDTDDDMVALTHSAASADNDYSGIVIDEVAVTVSDNDTAQVTGVSVTSGNAQLAVNWAAVDNATGYQVQWKSGNESYNTNRQATVTSGTTTSHTITGLTNGTEYTVRVSATRTDANDGPPSAEETGTPAVPIAPGVTVSTTALTVTEQDTAGDSYTVALDTEPTANVTVTVGGHSGTDVTPDPTTLTFTSTNWSTAQTVTVTAGDDADTEDDTVTLTHSAASTDTAYSGITIAGVAVTVSDNDSTTGGICGRTSAVRDALLDLIETNEGATVACADATTTHLAGITGTLDLSGQSIAALRAGDFAGLTGLTELYLYDNALSSLPGGVFDDLTALTRLLMNENGLTRLPARVFDQLTALTGLNLNSNGLTPTMLPAGVFDRLTALTTLDLSTNALSEVPSGVFDRLTALTHLFLNHNGLTRLPARVFDGPTLLSYLFLNNNGLTTLPENVFEPLTVLEALWLRENPRAPFAPEAVALPDDGTVPVDGGAVRLDGSGSGGAWGTNVTYSWALTPSTSGVTFDDNTSATPEVTIPPLVANAELTFTLTVTGLGGTDGIAPATDTAKVTARATATGVTVSETALTVAEGDTTGDSYTVVLGSQPGADVTVRVAGHAGTPVIPAPATLTFTMSNWNNARTVTVTAEDDADTANHLILLTHGVTSTDGNYSGIAVDGVTVAVSDNDTAEATWVTVTAGKAKLAVSWTAVDEATGYRVQWKSGGESYDASREAEVPRGSTTRHTIRDLSNGTEFTVRVIAVRAGAEDGPPSAEATGTPVASAPVDPGPLTLTVEAERETVTEGEPVRYRILMSKPTAGVVVGQVYSYEGKFLRHEPVSIVTGISSAGGVLYWEVEHDTLDDAVDEADGSFTVRLQPGEGYRLGTPSSVTVKILDDDEAEGSPASPVSPPLISVANARVREGPGAMLAFKVTLDRASVEVATVDWETLDGSAKAGQDYVADSGTLVFAPGETVKTVNVAVLDDAHDERQEVMLLLLSNAQGAVIGDAVAKGTIENSDRMPAAWLTRFGRAASDHVVEAVGERWQGGPRASHLTIGGHQAGQLFGWSGLGGQAERDTADDRDEPVGTDPSSIGLFAPSGGAGAELGATAPGMGVSGMNAMRGGPGGVDREAGRTLSGRAAQGALLRALGLPDPRAVPDLRTLLMGSSFFYSAALDDDGRARSPGRTRSLGWLGEWSAWGRTAATRFQGNDEGMALDGEVATAMLGFDSRWDRWLAGLVVSYSEGQGAYTHPTASGGAVTSTMTGLHPYARFELNERTSVWGVLGYGAGELSLTPERSETALGTDLTNAMAAFGGRTALSVRTGQAGRFELAVRSDARLTSTASDAIEGLVGAAGQTGRVRLMLEGSGSMPLATGGVLKPTLEAGLRYDAGDAETGAGLEVSGGLGYAAGRLSVEINARGLLAHEDTGYEEWGFSGSIAYTPSEDGRGLSMRLGSAWGATQSGVQSLWSRQDASGLVRNAAFDAAQRYQVELRYGFDGRKGHARWEPYVGVESGDGSSRALRLGVTLTSGRGLDAGLELGRRQGLPGADPEHAVQLRGALRW